MLSNITIKGDSILGKTHDYKDLNFMATNLVFPRSFILCAVMHGLQVGQDICALWLLDPFIYMGL